MDKLRTIVLYVSIILLVFFFLKGCVDNHNLVNGFNKQLQDSSTAIIKYKNAYGQEVVSKKFLEVEKGITLELLASKDKELKELVKQYSKVGEVIKIKTQFVRDTFRVHLKDTIPCIDSVSFEKRDKWLTLTGVVLPTDLFIDTLSIRNDISIVTGLKKEHWYSKKYQTIDIVNSNPYMSTYAVQAYSLKQPVKWYQTRLFMLGAGIITGAILTK